MELMERIDAKLNEGSISAKKLESSFQNFLKDSKMYLKDIDLIANDIQSADNTVGGTSMIRDNNIISLKGQVSSAISKYIYAVKQVVFEYKHIEKE